MNNTESDKNDITINTENKNNKECLNGIIEKKKNLQCKICNRNFGICAGLGNHISQTHKISTKEYYDKYLKTSVEGICLNCGKPTSYYRLGSGYLKYCSTKCVNNSKIIREKIEQTCLDRYGTKAPALNSKIVDKMVKTNREKWGVDYTWQNEDVKNTIKQACLKKYGAEHPSQTKDFQERIKKTRLIRYGVEYSLQSKEIQDKFKRTCIERYGVESTNTLYSVKKKKEKTMLKRYGVSHVCLLNPGCISKSQMELYEIIKQKYFDAIINYHISNLDKFADIFVPSLNLIIEYNGDYYHANPTIYKEDCYIQRCGMNSKQIWDRDDKRIKLLKSNGYKVIVIWESDWKKKREECLKLLENL